MVRLPGSIEPGGISFFMWIDYRTPTQVKEPTMMLHLATLVFLAAPVAVIAQTAPAPTAPAASAKLSIDSPIEVIAADPKGKVVLDANFPGMTANPMYEQFKTMTLKQVQPMSGGRMTEAAVAKTEADLAAIK